MKKINLLFCIICALLPTISAFSQKVTFTLYEFNPCNKVVEISSFFYLTNQTGEIYPSDSTGTCCLSDTGRYIINIPTEPKEERVFKEFKTYIDTIRISMIQPFFPLPSDKNSDTWGYDCCGIKCNGEQVDYFSNGNKRLEGKFKNGKPLGKMFFYHYNGNIKEIRKYTNRHYLKVIYYYNEEGELIKKEKKEGRIELY